jgi:hypothetical protein
VLANLRRAYRADPWLTIAFAALTVATVLPIWIGRYLPLLDLPNHLSAIAVWHYYDDPRFDFAKYYKLNLQPLPYWAHYYICHLLAYVVGVEAANRLFLTAYAIGLPAGALLLARRFRRSPWLSLFAFPLVWNFNLAEGFIAYVAGTAALVLGLVVVDRHAERPSVLRGLAVFAIGSSIYFFHLLPYMLFLVCAGLLVLAQRTPFSLERLIFRGVPVLACTAIGIWAYRHNASMGFGAMGFAAPLDEGKPQFVEDPLNETFQRAPGRLLNLLSSSRDEWVVVVLAAAWLALAITAARQRSLEDRTPFSARELGLELCLGASVLAIAMLPRSMLRPFSWYMINGRFVPVAALFAALAIRGPILGWRRWLMVPVFAASLFYAVDLSRMVVAFNGRVDGFDTLVAQIPLHKNTLTLVLPPLNDPEVNDNCYNQWPSYTQLRRGGYNFYNFNYGFPLRYRTYLIAPPWSHAESFQFDSYGKDWDYFLTHNDGVQFDLFSEPAKKGQVRLVAKHGPWALWERLPERAVPTLEPSPPPALQVQPTPPWR